jgi:hypothetical protein
MELDWLFLFYGLLLVVLYFFQVVRRRLILSLELTNFFNFLNIIKGRNPNKIKSGKFII